LTTTAQFGQLTGALDTKVWAVGGIEANTRELEKASKFYEKAVG
jgi:hypothetical protein